jgi:hypothetical protein
MRRIFNWFNKRFGAFDLLPQYFTAAGQQIQNVLWGALMPFLVWGIWFIVSTPPVWINWTAVLLALFIAGYYVWRADHVRLQQTIGITRVIPQRWVDNDDPATPLEVIAYYFEVVSTSEASTVEWALVELAEVFPEVLSPSWLPLPLRHKNDRSFPAQAKKDFNLNPGQKKHFDFVSAYKGDDHFDIQHTLPGVNTRVPCLDHHYLKVVITAKDTPALSQWFDVWMDEERLLQCEIMRTNPKEINWNQKNSISAE